MKFRLAFAVMKNYLLAVFICMPLNPPSTLKKIPYLLKMGLVDFRFQKLIRNGGVREVWEVLSKLSNLGQLVDKGTFF